jgi:lipopolysaccharide/colanic/teichoic acid biosynthesis glycosyltransferase
MTDLLSEPIFLEVLCRERKRAERSRNPFVLLLIDEPSRNGHHGTLLGRVADAIRPKIRETDIAGWYKQDSALAVLFLELGVTSVPAAVQALKTKVQAALEAQLGTAELAQIHTSFEVFPRDGGQASAADPKATAALYPDLAQRDREERLSRMVKRGIDILGSAVALATLAPLFGAIAVAIKLSSPGPVLFRQTRLGRYGMPFTFLKFRSMTCGNDPRIHIDYVTRFIAGAADAATGVSEDGAVYKITDDPRVTRVGRLLRRTSLDELPQLLNVLRGEMSLVGPRPPLPYEFEAYDVWHRRRVLEVKPGITGLWQVNGRSRLRFDEMVRLDLQYARTWSPWLDLRILMRTPGAVMSGKGAH